MDNFSTTTGTKRQLDREVTTTLNRKYSHSLPPCRRNIQHLSFDGTNKNAVENTLKHDISSENFIFLGEEAWTSSPDFSTKIINFFIYALQLSSSQGGRWRGMSGVGRSVQGDCREGGLSYCLSNQAFRISRFVSRNSGQINATGQPDSARTCLNGI